MVQQNSQVADHILKCRLWETNSFFVIVSFCQNRYRACPSRGQGFGMEETCAWQGGHEIILIFKGSGPYENPCPLLGVSDYHDTFCTGFELGSHIGPPLTSPVSRQPPHYFYLVVFIL